MIINDMSPKTSICVRLKSPTNTTLMRSSFIDLNNQSSYTYAELLNDLLDGQYAHCVLDRINCYGFSVVYGMSSTSDQCVHDIRGGPRTNIIDKVNNYHMNYFTLVVVHEEDCRYCLVSSTQRKQQTQICVTFLQYFSTVFVLACQSYTKNQSFLLRLLGLLSKSIS